MQGGTNSIVSEFGVLNDLADAYYRRMSGELNRRFAHHLGHVAPELWLAQELAYIVNDEGANLGLAHWNALLERKRVDVTLIPPGENNKVGPIYLELKLVPPSYWQNWREVYHDLAYHPEKHAKRNKPHAHFAVCFLVDVVSPRIAKQQSGTTERFRQLLGRIPADPGPFQPVDGFPPLWLEHSSPRIRALWPHPVHGAWPNGYESMVRILWVSSRNSFI